jgi:hypothetical protein
MRHFLGLASEPLGASGFPVPVSHVCSVSKTDCRTYGDAEQTELYYYRSVAGPEDVPHSRRRHLEESIADAPMQGNDLPAQSTGQRCHGKKKRRLQTHVPVQSASGLLWDAERSV